MLRVFCYPKFGGVEVLQTFRQTDPKPVVVRARAPAELAEALKCLATKQDVELSRVVRAALFAGVKIMLSELEAHDKAVTT